MRILNAGQNYFIAGGSDRYQLAIERLLAGGGHQVIPFAARAERNLASAWSNWFPRAADFAHPGPRDAFRYVYNRDAAVRLDGLLRQERVDLAHLHIYYGKLTGSILPVLRRHGIPIVQTLHEYKLVCPVYTMQRNGVTCHDCAGARFHHAVLHRCNRGSLMRSALTMAESRVSLALGAQSAIDCYIAPSEFVRQAVLGMGIPAEKVRTLHNFVDMPPAPLPAERAAEVVFAGRIERSKGVFTVLEVAARLPAMTFRMAGTGSASAELASAVRERGLGNVELPGFVEQARLQAMLARATVAIVPSEWDEPFGLSVVEAMACGTPVVASRVGGIPEIVTDAQDGFLCAPGNADAFAAAIRALAGNVDLAARMGAAARETALRRFSPANHLAGIERIYDDVLRARGRRA